MKKSGIVLILMLMVLVLLPGCSKTSEEAETLSIFAMDTYMSLTVYGKKGEEALDAMQEEILALEDLVSVTDESSEISILNTEGSVEASEETLKLMQEAISFCELTGGTLDISIEPVIDLWGFHEDEQQVPGEDDLEAALKLVDYTRISISDTTIVLEEGMEIDLGAVTKGYLSDRLYEIAEEYQLTGALLSLGGNIQTYGTKPDGSAWRIGIRDPEGEESDYFAVLEVTDLTVVTSGAYERYFTDEETGEVYHHILDPETGYPAESGLCSVTIVSADGALADGLSTACYIMGLQEAISFWQDNADDFDMILMDQNREIYVTEGIADSFSCDEDWTEVTR